jgi:hypothetical protein
MDVSGPQENLGKDNKSKPWPSRLNKLTVKKNQKSHQEEMKPQYLTFE